MSLILGIETSCDDVGVAVYDSKQKKMLSSVVFSPTAMHAKYGGVVPELASRAQFEHMHEVTAQALEQAWVSIDDISIIGVTYYPGLMSSLLIGVSFAKALAWAGTKKLIGVNHLEGHIYSAFLDDDGRMRENLRFPFLTMSVSGGHSSLYIVRSFSSYECIATTLDDAAGEAFDKVGRLIGFGYPAGPAIERAARSVGNQDFFSYPRHKDKYSLNFSFSGLKTAVLYDLVRRGWFDLKQSLMLEDLTPERAAQVASSLQVCISDIFEDRLRRAFAQYPDLTGFAFVGGVASNQYISGKLRGICERRGKQYVSPPLRYCTDNGAMIAFVTAQKAARGEFDNWHLDVVRQF